MSAPLHHDDLPDVFRLMADASPDWSYLRRGDGSLAYVSPACEAVSGYHPDAFMSDAGLMLRVVHPDDRSAFERHVLDCGAAAAPARFRIVTRLGAVRCVDHHCRELVGPAGTRIGVLGVHVDVTERLLLVHEAERAAETLAASPTVALEWLPEAGYPVSYASANVARWGYRPDDLTSGLPYTDLVHPDDVAATNAEVESNLASGLDEYHQRYRLRFADGDYRWVDDATSVVRAEDGSVLRLRGLVTDIDDRVRAQIALEQSEARLRRLAENAPDLIYRYELLPERRFTFVSPAATSMTGYTPEEHYEDPDLRLRLVHPDDRHAQDAAAASDDVAGAPLRLRWVRKDGSVIHIEQRTVPDFDEHGALVAIEGIARDVTEAEEAAVEVRRWANVVRRTQVGVTTHDPEAGTFDLVNPAFAAMHGWSVDELRGRPIASVLPLGERELLEDAIRIVRTQGRHTWRTRHLCADGTTFPVLVTAVEVGASATEPATRVVTVQDITEWEAAVAAQRASHALERRHAFVLEQSPSIVVLTDTSGVIEYVNRRFEEVTGWRRDDVIGRETRWFKSGLNDPRIYQDLWQTISEGKVWRGEFHNLRASGEAYWEKVTIAPMRDESGITTHYVKLSEDVSTTKALSLRVDQLAFYDPVTGVPNRALFADRLTHASAQSNRTGDPLAVLLVKLVGLRAVNGARGHVVGDRLLRACAQRLRSHLRESDTLARFSGSEFVIMLQPLRSSADAALVARKLQAAIREPFTLDGHQIFVNLNIGIAVAPDDGNDEETLSRNAATALHQARTGGPGEARFFTPELDRATQERIQLEEDLRAALARKEFWIAYQPRVDLRTGELTGFEALARWTHATAGPIAPVRFIPLAESTGLIHELGAEVLRLVLEQLRAWRAAGLPVVPVAVNLSAHEFDRPDVVERIAGALRDADVPAGWLEVELTESTMVTDVGRAVTTIAALRRLGVDVAIDDFGTGHASLSYLKRLQVSTLKIDQSFIRDLAGGEATRSPDGAIVQAIVTLGSTLGLRVVAEGVETEAQRDSLVEHGCPLAQGYLLGRPMPAVEAEAWFVAGPKPEAR